MGRISRVGHWSTLVSDQKVMFWILPRIRDEATDSGKEKVASAQQKGEGVGLDNSYE